MSNNNLFKKIFYLYYDGFKNMKLGKTLWLIIAITQKGSEPEYVSKELIQRSK